MNPIKTWAEHKSFVFSIITGLVENMAALHLTLYCKHICHELYTKKGTEKGK